MKEIYAIVRPDRDRQTKAALAQAGITACTTVRVLGRGRQGGLRYEENGGKEHSPRSMIGMRYLPKKLLYVVVDDGLYEVAVEAIIKANQTGAYGDGKIFVCEIENAIRVRTAEESVAAVW